MWIFKHLSHVHRLAWTPHQIYLIYLLWWDAAGNRNRTSKETRSIIFRRLFILLQDIRTQPTATNHQPTLLCSQEAAAPIEHLEPSVCIMTSQSIYALIKRARRHHVETGRWPFFRSEMCLFLGFFFFSFLGSCQLIQDNSASVWDTMFATLINITSTEHRSKFEKRFVPTAPATLRDSWYGDEFHWIIFNMWCDKSASLSW